MDSETILSVNAVSSYSNAVRIGYTRVSGRTQDHQMQLDALANAATQHSNPNPPRPA